MIWRNVFIGFLFLTSGFVASRYMYEFPLAALACLLLAAYFAWVMYKVYVNRVRREIIKSFEKHGALPQVFYDYFNIFADPKKRLLGLWVRGEVRCIEFDAVRDVGAWQLEDGSFELVIAFAREGIYDGDKWTSRTKSKARAEEFLKVVKGMIAGETGELMGSRDVEVVETSASA